MQNVKDIKTSYFSNWRKFPKGYEPIGVTQYAPPWWDGNNIELLAPSKNLLYNWKHGFITEYEYTQRYLEELNHKFTPEEVMSWFPEKTLLLCYEIPGNFCHRHILAEWLGFKDCEI